jgi:hypothetical protein
MTNEELYKELSKKIDKGIKLAHKKLTAQRARENGFLIVFHKGKIIKKKAKDLIK